MIATTTTTTTTTSYTHYHRLSLALSTRGKSLRDNHFSSVLIMMKSLLLTTTLLFCSIAAGAENANSDVTAYDLTASEPLHVDRLYTYGAPSVVKGSPTTSDPNNLCLPGIRIYNEDVDDVECSWFNQLWCTPGKQVTNVDFASQLNVKNGYHHPKVDTLVVRLLNGANVEYTYQQCNSYGSAVEEYQWWPEANLPADMVQNNHHMKEHYIPRLAQLPYSVQERSLQYSSIPVCIQESSWDAVKYCFNNYSEETAVGNAGVAGIGWEPLAYMKCETEGLLTDSDTVFVLKNDYDDSNRRSCIIGFQGSDTVLDLMDFVYINNEETSYCGRYGVHTGTANELWLLTHDPQYASEIVPALETCHEVTCVGHSLGGALCNLFTMCANSDYSDWDSNDSKSWDDYNSLIWTKKSYITDESSW